MDDIFWNTGEVQMAWIVGLSIVAFLLMAWIEQRKPRKTRLGLRLVAIFIALASLVLVLLEPAIKRTKAGVNGVFISGEYKAETLDSLNEAEGNQLLLFSSIELENDVNAIAVVDIDQIAHQYPEVENLYLLGEGLKNVRKRSPYPFKLIPLLNEPENGILEINYTNEVYEDDPVQVNGIIKTARGAGSFLFLEGPDGIVDSMETTPGISSFSFTDFPKRPGKMRYYLKQTNLADSLTRDPLPVIVKETDPLAIAIKIDAPAFEFRALKNWLGESGHRVAVRSQISGGVFRDEVINQPAFSAADVTQSVLDSVDLFVITSTVLSQLGEAQLALLEGAVKEKGLGLLILADTGLRPLLSSPRLQFFMDFDVQSSSKSAVNVEQVVAGAVQQRAVGSLPFRISSGFNVRSFHQGLYGFRNIGKGKVGLSLAGNTYPLILEGNKPFYERFWSDLIKSMLPEHSDKAQWKLEEPFAFVHHPFQLSLHGHSSTPAGVVTDPTGRKVNIPMIQNKNFNDRWGGKFWPERHGWHTIQVASDSSVQQSFYVAAENSWTTYQREQKRKQLLDFVYNSTLEDYTTSPVYDYHTINKIYFFAIFLLSCGSLWLEQKL